MDRRTALKRSIAGVTALSIATFSIATYADSTRGKGQKSQNIVIQLSDDDAARGALALANARNLQIDLGASKVGIELVAYGPGVDLFKLDSTLAEPIAGALADGVVIVVCENTLHAKKLAHEDMLPGVGFVKSGAGEIMRRQLQGWAYLRP